MKKLLLSLLAVSSTVLIAVSPAKASNWVKMGVSTVTKETIALDVDSIDRVSQYDVKFRYLIGKDIVQASANCDSSMITPDQGKPFQPNMSGATRNLLNRVCKGGTSDETSYGQRERFQVSQADIETVRRISEYDFGREMWSTAIYNDLQVICTARSNGATTQSFLTALRNRGFSDARRDYTTSLLVVAEQSVCP